MPTQVSLGVSAGERRGGADRGRDAADEAGERIQVGRRRNQTLRLF
jgi:hypothetical protein